MSAGSGSPEAWVAAGALALVDGDAAAAAEMLSKAIAVDSGNASVWSALAQAHLQTGDYLEALEAGVKATSLDGNSVMAWLRLGQAYFRQAEFETAMDAFEKAKALATLPAHVSQVQAWVRKTEAELAEVQATVDDAREGPAADEQPSTSAAGDAEQLTEPMLGKYRYQWYQAGPKVVVDVMAKNVARDRVRVKCTERTLEVVLLDEAGQVEFALPVRLWGRVQPGQVRVEVLRPKVEVAMRKADMADWKQLEAAEAAPAPPPAAPKPYASKKDIDWDRLEVELKEAEKNEKLEGEAALQKLFKDIYANADEDTRRAMIKSYVESNGTALSTNWKEVGTKKIETLPPSGMEAKPFAE